MKGRLIFVRIKNVPVTRNAGLGGGRWTGSFFMKACGWAGKDVVCRYSLKIRLPGMKLKAQGEMERVNRMKRGST